MMPEKKAEDIISRLEALRKKVPEEKPAEKPPAPERKVRARVVGLLVVILLLGIVSFAGYRFYLQPKTAAEKATAAEEQARLEAQRAKIAEERARLEAEQKALLEAKAVAISNITEAFQGLPPKYAAAKDALIERVNLAPDMAKLQTIDFASTATSAWISYRLGQVDALAETAKNIELLVGAESFRSLQSIKERIQTLSYGQLKNIVLREVTFEYVPIRLQRVPAGGFPKEGYKANIYYRKSENETIYLARNAEVINLLLEAKSGTIALSEVEARTKTGGGVEGVGTLPSLSIGSTAGTLTGTFTGSAGTAMSQVATTLTIDLTEVQKAYAANKISEKDFTQMLDKYGLKLGDIEESTGFGQFDREYLLLVKVTSFEAPDLVSKLFTLEDRDKIYFTFTSIST